MINELLDTKEESAIQLKGSLFTLTVLQLLKTDLRDIASNLTTLATKLPNFFQHTPIVLDLLHVRNASPIDFDALINIIQANKMIPVGVRNGSIEQQHAAIRAGLGILPKSKDQETDPAFEDSEQETELKSEPQKTVAASKSQTISNSPAKVIAKPVRSGQQIYAKGGDLIVLAPVSHGAELLADGHIHIYGKLNGRALAGIQGDTHARIFCRGLDAELVSIAGFYRVKEDLDTMEDGLTTQIYLQDEKLIINSF